MFFIGLIMRIQMPVFTPFAATLGASSIIIGIILSVTSFSNLIGNIIAGPLIDQYGKKVFIVVPMLASAILFFLHGMASSSTDLVILHAMNGFALAFLIPAAFTLLSGYAKNNRQQGKNMAVYGILSTITGIVSPMLGGTLVEFIGYENTYFFIGTAMLLTTIYTFFYLRDRQLVVVNNAFQKKQEIHAKKMNSNLSMIYLIAFAVMYLHGVLVYEIPYLTVDQGISTSDTGKLFSFMGIGTLLTLSLFFIHRFEPLHRLLTGLTGMSLTIYCILVTNLPLYLLLLLIGIFFGLIMPAMATAITERTPREMHGRAFGYLSAVYSLGIITSSFITGAVRDFISPYFIGFLVGMLVVTMIIYNKIHQTDQPKQAFVNN